MKRRRVGKLAHSLPTGVGMAAVDLGPAIRRKPVHGPDGALLRPPDLAIDDQAVDPRFPTRRVRRAYRVDPVDALLRAGTIGRRELDAVTELRGCLERLAPSMSAGALRIAVSTFSLQPIAERHVRAAKKLREASMALGAQLWPAVIWVALGGSVKGYASEHHLRHATASGLVASGMARLAEHFYGRSA